MFSAALAISVAEHKWPVQLFHIFPWSNMSLIDSSSPLITSCSVLLARCNLEAERCQPGYSRLGFRQRAWLLGEKNPRWLGRLWSHFHCPLFCLWFFPLLTSIPVCAFHPCQANSQHPVCLAVSFFFFQGSVFTFFFRSLSLCRRDCGLTEVQIQCCFIHFFLLFIFFVPAYFSLLPGDTLSILILN